MKGIYVGKFKAPITAAEKEKEIADHSKAELRDLLGEIEEAIDAGRFIKAQAMASVHPLAISALAATVEKYREAIMREISPEEFTYENCFYV